VAARRREVTVIQCGRTIDMIKMPTITVCQKLELSLTDDATTRLIASKIIELAERGVRDAATLSTNDAERVQAFKHY
jgi:hypothetical protein